MAGHETAQLHGPICSPTGGLDIWMGNAAPGDQPRGLAAKDASMKPDPRFLCQ